MIFVECMIMSILIVKDFKKLEEIDEIFYEFISKNIANREFVKFIDNSEIRQNNASERTSK